LKLALLMLGRKEADRALDVSESLRLQAKAKFQAIGGIENESQVFIEYTRISAVVSEQAMGESLPSGLIMASREKS